VTDSATIGDPLAARLDATVDQGDTVRSATGGDHRGWEPVPSWARDDAEAARRFPQLLNANGYARGPSANSTDGLGRQTPTSRGPSLCHARGGGQGRTLDREDY
jgi:hypothetical protein